jgi:uncharacterized protein (TIGR03435 family)
MSRTFLIALLASSLWAQKADVVSSIKPNKSNDNRRMFSMMPGGRMNATNVTLKALIVVAYGIREYQISGLPSWAESERYDVMVKPDGATDEAAPPARPPTDAEMKTQQERNRAMLQAVLADRFGLVVHKETKELPIYSLVVGKNGPKLTEATEQPPMEAESGGPQIARGGAAGAPVRGAQMIRMGRGQLSGQMPISALASQLSSSLGRNVIDNTGLTGSYDIKLTWSPEDGAPVGPDAPPSESGPSVFTAIQEQLGLKLENSKGQVEVVFVDKAQKPTEN